MRKISTTGKGERVARTSDGMRREYDFSKATRGKYTRRFANRPWWVQLDADLVDLLSSSGDPADRLRSLARRRKARSASIVQVIPLTNEQYAPLKALLARIGAEVTWVESRVAGHATRRKAG